MTEAGQRTLCGNPSTPWLGSHRKLCLCFLTKTDKGWPHLWILTERERLEVLGVGQCPGGRTFPFRVLCDLPRSCTCRVTSFPPHEYTQVHIHGFKMATEPMTTCLLIWSLHVSWVMSLRGEFRAQDCPSSEAPAHLVTRDGSYGAGVSLLGWQTSICPILTRKYPVSEPIGGPTRELWLKADSPSTLHCKEDRTRHFKGRFLKHQRTKKFSQEPTQPGPPKGQRGVVSAHTGSIKGEGTVCKFWVRPCHPSAVTRDNWLDLAVPQSLCLQTGVVIPVLTLEVHFWD